MSNCLRTFLTGVAVYGGIGTAMIALWGAVDAAIIAVASILLGVTGRWKNLWSGANGR
jgi:hypothetical protein